MDTTVLFQALVSGLLFGGVFALAAVGLTLIFGVLKIINFAHGEFVMLGMYLSYFANSLFGIDPFLSLFLLFPVFFLGGALIQRYLIERVLAAREEMQILLVEV